MRDSRLIVSLSGSSRRRGAMMPRLLLVCLASILLLGAAEPERCSSLLTVEGEVLDLGHQPGEGLIDLITVTLAGSEGVDPETMRSTFLA